MIAPRSAGMTSSTQVEHLGVEVGQRRGPHQRARHPAERAQHPVVLDQLGDVDGLAGRPRRQLVERVVAGRPLGLDGVDLPEDEGVAPHRHHVAVVQPLLVVQALAVQEGAVGAVEVDDVGAVGPQLDLRVPAGQQLVGEIDIAVLGPPDGGLGSQRDATLRPIRGSHPKLRCTGHRPAILHRPRPRTCPRPLCPPASGARCRSGALAGGTRWLDPLRPRPQESVHEALERQLPEPGLHPAPLRPGPPSPRRATSSCRTTSTHTWPGATCRPPPGRWRSCASTSTSPSRGDDVNQEDRVVPADLPRVDFYHWVLVDLPADAKPIAEGEFSRGVTARGKPGPGRARARPAAASTTTPAGSGVIGRWKASISATTAPARPGTTRWCTTTTSACSPSTCPASPSMGPSRAPEAVAALKGHVLGESFVRGQLRHLSQGRGEAMSAAPPYKDVGTKDFATAGHRTVEDRPRGGGLLGPLVWALPGAGPHHRGRGEGPGRAGRAGEGEHRREPGAGLRIRHPGHPGGEGLPGRQGGLRVRGRHPRAPDPAVPQGAGAAARAWPPWRRPRPTPSAGRLAEAEAALRGLTGDAEVKDRALLALARPACRRRPRRRGPGGHGPDRPPQRRRPWSCPPSSAACSSPTDAEAYGGEDKARAALAKDAKDLEARYALASALAARGQSQEALDHFLEIAARNRKFKDDGARLAMLAIFDQLGGQHELTQDYRRRLQIVL